MSEQDLEKIKKLEDENKELKEVITELSQSMKAINDLSGHMKLAALLFCHGGEIKIPKRDSEAAE